MGTAIRTQQDRRKTAAHLVQVAHQQPEVALVVALRPADVPLLDYCNIIEAPWLVSGGHGASLRHHTRLAQRAFARGRGGISPELPGPIGGSLHPLY
jgi:hypothetical protein